MFSLTVSSFYDEYERTGFLLCPLQRDLIQMGHGSGEHAAEAIRLGATGYITKPIDPLSLRTALL